MGDRYSAQKEDIRLWCEHVGAKRVYQCNVHLRTILSRLERFEQETGLSYPGIGNWGQGGFARTTSDSVPRRDAI